MCQLSDDDQIMEYSIQLKIIFSLEEVPGTKL